MLMGCYYMIYAFLHEIISTIFTAVPGSMSGASKLILSMMRSITVCSRLRADGAREGGRTVARELRVTTLRVGRRLGEGGVVQ